MPALKVENPADLLTPSIQTKAGFVALALERNVRATPFIGEARALYAIVAAKASATDLLEVSEIQRSLLTAAGVSEKSSKYLTADGKAEAVREFVASFLEPAGSKFAEELVYRFLLTKGDTLGGAMRNISGVLGERKFTRAMISTLSVKNRTFSILRRGDNRWVELPARDPTAEDNVRGLSWLTNNSPRTLIYNVRVPVSDVNVDLSLMRCRSEVWKECISEPSQFLALGELKGGIDPAGAYEHWATSRSAISTSRSKFAQQEHIPDTFFIGAAITQRVADQVWDFLKNKTLTRAANLTDDDQLHSICDWITSL